MTAAELLLRLLAGDRPALVTSEDADAVLGEAFGAWQGAGFLGREAGRHPVPGCPHCGEGVPYRVNGRHVCNCCHGEVDPRHLAAWALDREAVLNWLAHELRLRGGVRPVGDALWQLGAWEGAGGPCECFFLGDQPLTEAGRARLEAYQDVLVLHGTGRPAGIERLRVRTASLLALLGPGPLPAVADPARFFRPRGDVRFDGHSGALWVGARWAGEVPVGSKEYFLVQCLAQHLDRFVPYADLKREVQRRAGSADTRDEAGFCQQLKRRLKEKYVPAVDRLIVTTNKADGYRLRGYAEL
jgi:hypothetical protein